MDFYPSYSYNFLLLCTDFLETNNYVLMFSRFMALTFDGLYFRYTLRWPIVQLIFPYMLSVSVTHISEFVDKLIPYISLLDDSRKMFLTIPNFLACSLDFVTHCRLKKVKGITFFILNFS